VVLGAMLTELWPAAPTGLAPLLVERTP
jgi:hypothetical protein